MKFTTKNIKLDGEYVIFMEGDVRLVMARFKYAMSSSKGLFKKTIINSGLSVKEYFARARTSSPMEIAEEFGFVPKHLQKRMEEFGLPVRPTTIPFLTRILISGEDPVAIRREMEAA